MTSPSSLQLRDGPIVRETAVSLALSLEARGHVMTAHDDKLTVSEGSRLTAEDRAAIARERLHLLAIVVYCAEGR
jgi:hypothetical protein